MDEETVSPMKKLTKLVTHTSYQFFDSFVNDTEEKAKNVRKQGEFVLELQKAAVQNSLVVLQVRENRLSNKHETVSGWVATKIVEKERVMIRLRNEEQQIRMIPIEQIEKITSLSPSGEQERLSR
ncbi:hypothetical protein K5E_22990 [Enterococcus thailandicus]|mgnify:CR=1 FL=1|uniref:Uncharacterized protein n=2 Tax=root TaxID=1 RepID=A0A1L8XPA7_ENTTH|nr:MULTISPECIES: hypothetical protein [Enterococcus]ASZ06525.1 hypothetical protein CK496_00740 [Enterococcus thailandicus]MDA3964661.1 hypothetical protein [Enterococcus thailandicus]MDA3974178.1 hypothetical protein [Enterococcus thailandicus]MDA3976660.1 hypothetical protein [Enterococcus thailandicus]MDA3981632.1 hypothetical protein [Enterococcus thailandicus]